MNELFARDVLSDDVVLVGAENHLSDLQRLIDKKRPSHLAVFEGGEFLGVVSLRESVQHSRSRIFADLLTSGADQAVPDDTPLSDLQNWDWFKSDAIAVVDSEGKYQGIITQASLISALLQDQSQARQRIQKLFTELRIVMRRGVMSEFAAAFAHEVHQPLAAIANYAHGMKSGLERGTLSAEMQLQALAEILDSCKAAADIVHRLRDFLCDQMPPATAVDPVEVVDDALALVKPLMEQRGVTCSWIRAAEMPLVLGVPASLVQVVYNLLLNAVEAFSEDSDPADRRIQITTGISPQGMVQFVVEDNGPGIPAEIQPQVFDPLFTTKPGNYGLGLSLCRSTISHLGGEVLLEDREPHGCRVHVVLPVQDATPESEPAN